MLVSPRIVAGHEEEGERKMEREGGRKGPKRGNKIFFERARKGDIRGKEKKKITSEMKNK